MNIELFTCLGYVGDITLEITADGLLKVMKDFANEKASYLLAKMDEEPSLNLISREEVMNVLKVTHVRTLLDWEERGYLNPYSDGSQNLDDSQIFYLMDEVLLLKNFAEFLIVKPLGMKINFFNDFLKK